MNNLFERISFMLHLALKLMCFDFGIVGLKYVIGEPNHMPDTMLCQL